MEQIRLGKTNLTVSASAFGALPIQRVDRETAVRILRRAFEGGINFYDTANGYTDSEEKLGAAFSGLRHEVILATKSGAADFDGVMRHIELSLRRLGTDYIDLLQLHNPRTLPDPQDPQSSYAALAEAKKRGWIRHIGITSHSVDRARAAVESGLYETLQYPFCLLAHEKDVRLAELARAGDMGFIAMKALAGGRLSNAAAAFTYLKQFPWVVPIWGVQKLEELEEFLALEQNPPALDEAMRAVIADYRSRYTEKFCHSCGYCLPCPADIDLPMTARMALLLGRARYQPLLSPRVRESMLRVKTCVDCGACRSRCPYELNPAELSRENLAFYEKFYEEHKTEAPGE